MPRWLLAAPMLLLACASTPPGPRPGATARAAAETVDVFQGLVDWCGSLPANGCGADPLCAFACPPEAFEPIPEAPSPELPREDDCGNGMDDDGDLATDCRDEDCDGDTAACPDDCGNGIDDDNDGKKDCEEPTCQLDDACPEDCTNRKDDDDDGRLDCRDPYCCLAVPPHAACIRGCLGDGPKGGELTDDRSCVDRVDNDRDGRRDCADLDCLGAAVCLDRRPVPRFPLPRR